MANWVSVRVNGIPVVPMMLFGDGTAAAPSMAFASESGSGLWRVGGGQLAISILGNAFVGFDNSHGLRLASDARLAWNATSANPFTTAGDLLLGRESAAVLQLGVDAAGVTDQMIKGPDRITSDGVGGNLTIAGGRNRGASAGGSIIFQTSPAAGAGVAGTLATRQTIDSAGNIVQGAGGIGSVTSKANLVKKVTAIADNTATTILTATVPNGNHACAVRVLLLSSNGGADAFESSRIGSGVVVIQRISGASAVATAATLDDAAIATCGTGGSATHTLAYSVVANAEGAGGAETVSIKVTIDDSGGTGANQCVVFAEVLNAEASGVTVA